MPLLPWFTLVTLIWSSFDVLVSSAMKSPKFLQEVGWKSPTEPHDGFVQYANQTKLHIFDYLVTQGSLFQDFNLFMGNTMGTREYWCDWYDIKGRLVDGYDKERGGTLLVDVAGGKGHDLQAFHNKSDNFGKNYKGALVLQETKGVLDGINENELNPNIERMEYDFFTPQPVKGAYSIPHMPLLTK